jgi:PncC family amidohydrolase
LKKVNRYEITYLAEFLSPLFIPKVGEEPLFILGGENKLRELNMNKYIIEEEVGDALRKSGLTVATAESCTGGLVGHRITNVSGSSGYYRGGITAYANDVKAGILQVAQEILEEKGAVSAECAEAMAKGVRTLLDTDIGISTTGIAGPTGGTPGKPVGLVYIALATKDYVDHEKHIFHRDREGNKREAAEAALRLLLRYLSTLLYTERKVE